MNKVTELSILEFLGRTGKLGFPLNNMLSNDLRRAAPRDLLMTLRSLENRGLIKLSGARSLDDLARLIEERSQSLVAVEQQKGPIEACRTNHYILFHDQPGFVGTSIRPTLRGLLALTLQKITRDERRMDLVAKNTESFGQNHDVCEDVPHRGSAAPTASCAEPKPGDRMADGTIFAGISPDTHKAMYATPKDAPLTYTFNGAAKDAEQLNAQNFLGHDDWRVPTKGELNVLFQNRAAIGGLDVSGSFPAGWYWSSSQDGSLNAWAQRFSDGYQNYDGKGNVSSLRCVR